MGPVSGVVVYFLLWWIIFLCVLPFREEPQINKVPGTPAGAPEHAFIKKKMLATCLITAAVWIVVYIMIDIRIIDFREWAAEMPLV